MIRIETSDERTRITWWPLLSTPSVVRLRLRCAHSAENKKGNKRKRREGDGMKGAEKGSTGASNIDAPCIPTRTRAQRSRRRPTTDAIGTLYPSPTWGSYKSRLSQAQVLTHYA
ncbi:hypothetical protein GCM10027081_51250 [Cupriavidus yeoncheonensis]